MTDRPVPIERWRLEAAGSDSVLAGVMAGEAHVSGPIALLWAVERYARTVDGTEYLLGTPDPEVASADRLPEDPAKRRIEGARAAMLRIGAGVSPTADELAAAPLLEFWGVLGVEPVVLFGQVSGHPGLDDGRVIHTSLLLWLAADRKAARTVSRFYRLGTPFGSCPPVLH